MPIFRDPIFDARTVRRTLEELAHHARLRRLGIKCPDYLARREVPPRLAALSPTPKVIACLRDPVARAVSAYFWHVRWSALPVEDPNVGLWKVLKGAYADHDPRVDEILSWGCYGSHLKRYLEYFDRDRIFVTFDDRLRAVPAAVFRELFVFLGIASNFVPDLRDRDSNEGIYDQRRLRFVRRRNKYILHWSSDATHVELLPPRRPLQWTYTKSVAAIDRYLLAPLFGNNRPALNNRLEQELRAYYREDIESLERALHVDLARWK